MPRGSWCILWGLVFLTMSFISCFSADSEPSDDDGMPADDAGGDDTAFDDDLADDTAGDDTAADDGADDDADDSDDDTGSVTVDCGQIATFVYEMCGDTFVEKSNDNHLQESEAQVECESGGNYWECIRVCLNQALTQPQTQQCAALIDCAGSDCTNGSVTLVDMK